MINLTKYIDQEELEELYLNLKHIKNLPDKLKDKAGEYQDKYLKLSEFYNELLKGHSSNLHKMLLYGNINHTHTTDSFFQSLMQNIEWANPACETTPNKQVFEEAINCAKGQFKKKTVSQPNTICDNIKKALIPSSEKPKNIQNRAEIEDEITRLKKNIII